MDAAVIAGTAAGAGAVVGWLAKHWRNGNGAPEQIRLLREIRDNTSGLPAVVDELRRYMQSGYVAMKQIERLDRLSNG